MMLACVLGLIVCNAVPGTILHLFFSVLHAHGAHVCNTFIKV